MGSLGTPISGPSVSGREALVDWLKSRTCVALGLDESLFTNLTSSAEGLGTINSFLEDERAADSSLLVYEVKTEIVRKKRKSSIASEATSEGVSSSGGAEGVAPEEIADGGEGTAPANGRASQHEAGARSEPEVSETESRDTFVAETSGVAAAESSSGRLSANGSIGPSRRASALVAGSRRESAVIHPEPPSDADEDIAVAGDSYAHAEEEVEVEVMVELKACLGALPDGVSGRAVYFLKKEAGKLRSKEGLEFGVLAEGPSLHALEVVSHSHRTWRKKWDEPFFASGKRHDAPQSGCGYIYHPLTDQVM
jgi:hypothetical protein